MNVTSINQRESTLSWAGVGNVEGVLLPAGPALAAKHLISVNDFLGSASRLRVHPATHNLQANDLLLFATDGIRGGFTAGLNRADTTRRIADAILAGYCTDNDDALVLVARYLGGAR